MTQYEIYVTDLAKSQMQEIFAYISSSLRAPDSAMKTLKNIEAAVMSLSELPNRMPLTGEEPWHSEGIRKMLVKNFIVYYWVDETAKLVHVTGVTYARREQKNVLAAMDMD